MFVKGNSTQINNNFYFFFAFKEKFLFQTPVEKGHLNFTINAK
jgi:hypothetical protein